MSTRTVLRRITRIVAISALPAFTIASCGGSDDSNGFSLVCTVSAVSITPGTAEASIGLTTQLAASVEASHCSPNHLIAWQSSAPHIATVSDAGLVTGVAPGTATITATAAGKTGSATVTVRVPVASVTLSAPGTSVVIGSTMQATAQAKDANGNVLTGRQFAWLSSNDAVATVSQSGVITGLTAGNVTITVNADNKSATLNVAITGAATLSITNIIPAAGSEDLSIESAVQIQFSAALDATTVTPASVKVTSGATTIAGTLAVNGNTVTFTPSPLLTEFRTAYTVTVSVDVLSNVGNHLPNQATSTFTTAFWDPAYYYKLSTEFLGPNKVMDTFSDTFSCFFGDTGNFNGQFWYFVPTNSPGYYAIRNAFQGEAKALEGGDVPTACLLTGTPPGGYFTGQLWKPVAFGSGYRLQNLNLGAAKSLDTPIIDGTQKPGMMPTANASGQRWFFARTIRR